MDGPCRQAEHVLPAVPRFDRRVRIEVGAIDDLRYFNFACMALADSSKHGRRLGDLVI